MTVGAGVLLLSLGAALGATPQEAKPEAGPRFRVVETTRTSEMQSELSSAGAGGYAVLAGAPGIVDEMTLILEQTAPGQSFEYLLVSTNRTSTFEEELNAGAARGFRLLPRTLIVKHHAESILLGRGYIELVGVMAKGPGPAVQYRVLATSRTSTLQKEITQTSELGYDLAGLLSRGEHIAVLEKSEESAAQAAASGGGEQRYLLLATTRPKTMQKELDQAAAAGYRVRVGSPTSGKEMVVILEKVGTPEPFTYLVVTADTASTFLRDLNTAAGRGFRLLPSTLIAKAKGSRGEYEMAMVLEKVPGSSGGYEYRVMGAGDETFMQNRMSEAAAEGFAVVGIVHQPSPEPQFGIGGVLGGVVTIPVPGGRQVVILEKVPAPPR